MDVVAAVVNMPDYRNVCVCRGRGRHRRNDDDLVGPNPEILISRCAVGCDLRTGSQTVYAISSKVNRPLAGAFGSIRRGTFCVRIKNINFRCKLILR